MMQSEAGFNPNKMTTPQAAAHLKMSAGYLNVMRHFDKGPKSTKDPKTRRVTYKLGDLDKWNADRLAKAEQRSTGKTAKAKDDSGKAKDGGKVIKAKDGGAGKATKAKPAKSASKPKNGTGKTAKAKPAKNGAGKATKAKPTKGENGNSGEPKTPAAAPASPTPTPIDAPANPADFG
jgi:hypothetical protein